MGSTGETFAPSFVRKDVKKTLPINYTVGRGGGVYKDNFPFPGKLNKPIYWPQIVKFFPQTKVKNLLFNNSKIISL